MEILVKTYLEKICLLLLSILFKHSSYQQFLANIKWTKFWFLCFWLNFWSWLAEKLTNDGAVKTMSMWSRHSIAVVRRTLTILGFLPLSSGSCRVRSTRGECCVFPFVYKGRKYTSCTTVNSRNRRPWCASTPNYDVDKLWGYCRGRGGEKYIVIFNVSGFGLFKW